ncbi:MAG: pilin [Patescibacteria group bacterium]|nr:pilin [Patescibacteria group bacterium]
MRKKILKIFIVVFVLVAVFAVAKISFAQINLGLEYGNATGLAATDPRLIIGRIIQIFLGLLGVIALGLIIYGGFLWMTAGGNEEQIERAKKTLVSAIIGLAIILSAFGIATFILNSLLGATGAGPGGGNNIGGPPGGGINGAGAIGECSVQNVYPVPNQMAVFRNTAIFVTFKEAVDPKTICASADKGVSCCASADNNGKCLTPSAIKISNVQIYKSNDGDNPSTNMSAQVLVTADHKTYTFRPASYLGSETDSIWYTVNLTADVQRESNHTSAFTGSGCSGSLNWQFQVSNKIDLIPPQVISSGVYPPPDNGRDSEDNVLAARAAGSITASATRDPQYFVAATGTVAKAVAGDPSTPDASITVDPNLDAAASNLKVVVSQKANGFKAALSTSAGDNLTSADFVGSTVIFTGTYSFSLAAKGDLHEGNSWLVDLTAAKQADSLQVGSLVYTFVKKSGADNQITVTGVPADLAANIAAALAKQAGITADISAANPDQVSVSAATAGAAGNNINLSFNSPAKSGALVIVPMSGGADGSSSADPDVNTAGNQPDQPMNTVIQINFNEPILPTTVVGNSADVSAIQVVDADGKVVSGKFAIANLYQTVEFTSDNQCGVNGCGEPIYCLPPDSHLTVKIKAASLASCDTNADCVGKNVDGKNYDQCLDNICSQNLGGNYAAADPPAPEVRRYPLANLQASPSGGPDGVTDAAFNSLDGDRNNYADGPAANYNDNPPIYSNNQSCQDNFEKIIKAVIAARVKQNKVLGEITSSYCSSCACGTLSPAGCESLMNTEMKNLGLPGAIKDSGGNLFIFDENENEPGYGACRIDNVSSVSCGSANIPYYYCANGDNFSWSFYVNKEMDTGAPVVSSVSPAAGETPKVGQDIKINFSKLMMATTLITGSTIIDNGQAKVTHKNINLWNTANNPVGYWIQTETIFGNNSPLLTNAIIKHGDFGESSAYRAQAGSAVRDIHQNCFKPSGDQSTCKNVSETQPSCCYGVATKNLDANGDCP